MYILMLILQVLNLSTTCLFSLVGVCVGYGDGMLSAVNRPEYIPTRIMRSNDDSVDLNYLRPDNPSTWDSQLTNPTVTILLGSNGGTSEVYIVDVSNANTNVKLYKISVKQEESSDFAYIDSNGETVS